MTTVAGGDIRQYLSTRDALEAARSQLSRNSNVPGRWAPFNTQLAVLRQHLAENPRQFRQLFISSGIGAVAAEFQKDELGAEFMHALGVAAAGRRQLAGGSRFLWDVPLRLKRKFIRAIATHLTDQYPMFAGLHEAGGREQHPALHPGPGGARASSNSSTRATSATGTSATPSARWTCSCGWRRCGQADAGQTLQLGILLEEEGTAGRLSGPDPHPRCWSTLLGGQFARALENSSRTATLPNVTGGVCPQELQCQGVCAHHKRPIEIGRLGGSSRSGEKAVEPDAMITRYGGRPDPWRKATKPPIAIVGSARPASSTPSCWPPRATPSPCSKAFHELGGVLRYGIPEFRLPNELIDDVVAKIKLLGGRFVTNFVVGKTASSPGSPGPASGGSSWGPVPASPQFMNVPDDTSSMSARFLTPVEPRCAGPPARTTTRRCPTCAASAS